MSEPSLSSSPNSPDTLKEDATLPLSNVKGDIETEIPKMSKNQQKKLIRETRRKETKAEWRKLQKAKRKLKEQVKKEEYNMKGKI